MYPARQLFTRATLPELEAGTSIMLPTIVCTYSSNQLRRMLSQILCFRVLVYQRASLNVFIAASTKKYLIDESIGFFLLTTPTVLLNKRESVACAFRIAFTLLCDAVVEIYTS